MDIQVIAAISFIVLLAVVVFLERKKLVIQKVLFPLIYIALYRTKLGLKQMDQLAKRFPRALRFLGSTGVVIGFLGMALICYKLIENAYKIFFLKEAVPGVGVLQPFSKTLPGTVYVPFFYLLLSLFVLVIVHEFSHGVIARVYNMKVNSSGFAVLAVLIPVFPAAFVEPDEKELVKRSAWQQMSVFAAGPFANIITAILVIVAMILIAMPVGKYVVQSDGVVVNGFVEEGVYPAQQSGLLKGSLITHLDNERVTSLKDFTKVMQNKKPGDSVVIATNVSTYTTSLVSNPVDTQRAYMGVLVSDHGQWNANFIERYGEGTAKTVIWLMGLLFWLYVLNLGVGLFNLVPIPLLDGGRMLQTGLHALFGKKREYLARKTWKTVGLFFVLLIFAVLFKGCTGG
ncbi:TPA: PDZ domain-containing protein [Candidatus Woesearchaeota archaeon]|nr:PDZ domain-containing protein [Candidatus Woesearchaeota archaeon]HIH47859.1 PDZ domain-containing protein [Candidatus Woesearchaeota archaeon]HII88350.1 PDZ domain-containing protein [Candidatus Woesearchaeota archaeon]